MLNIVADFPVYT